MFQLSGLQFIDKTTLTGRHRTVAKGVGSVFENDGTVTYDPFTLNDCIIQPTSRQTLLTLPEGLRDKITYELWTTTAITGVIEGSSNLGDQVQYDFGAGSKWFTVFNAKKYNTSFLGNYNCILVKDPE